MASLMVLAIPCPSLPIILKFSTDVVCPVVLLCSNIGDGALKCKYSVINTLKHRAKAVCFNPKLLEEEMKHLHEVLQQCKYPKWAINKVLKHQEHRRTRNRRIQGRNTSQTQKTCHIVVPYTKSLCESYKTICGKYGAQLYFKGRYTLKNLLMFPMDKEEMTKQSNIIYWYKCGRTECDDK